MPAPDMPVTCRNPWRALLAAALLGGASLPAAAMTNEELAARVERLSNELTAVRAELAALQSREATSAVPAAAAAPAGPTPSAAAGPTWFGYGEINYSRPRTDGGGASADVGRFVLGAGYAFDDRTRFVSELEVEHTIASADDAGEIEVEQAYIEHELTERTHAKLGLFLMPVGLLNESHEPTRYYGVFRNFVETAIIPTTWREGGVLVGGVTDAGLRWNVGLTTGFDLGKWDAASTEGAESPLGSVHQELSLARAADLGGVASLAYSGIPGLTVGGSLYSGGASQGRAGLPSSRVTLWESHARWMPARWELSALYARGSISGTAALNLPLVGNPTLIPSRFDGGYLEAAYRAYSGERYRLTPFARLERFNTGAAYAALPAGLTPAATPATEVLTVGASLSFAPGVVAKADYQSFRHATDRDRFNLGLGYQF